MLLHPLYLKVNRAKLYAKSKRDEGMILKTQVAWKNEVQKK